jgi:hypothetical protein
MPNEYFSKSKEIANEFIQNIVFIDDEANNVEVVDGDHQLNSSEITKGFAKSQKICAVYNPSSEADIVDLISICKKADIVVLDWKIDLIKPVVEGQEEVDEEIDDPRGRYTIQIIRDILLDEETGKDSLKLIIVYTGETDLRGITKSIFDALNSISGIQRDDFSVFTKNFRILTIGKPMLLAKHSAEIADRIIGWNQLPDFILKEFTTMTSGLLSDTVLKALIAIRRKAFRLLKTFSPSMDPAFLGHKALLPNPEDAEEQLLDIIGSEIKSILKSFDTNHYISTDTIKSYIEGTLEDKKYPFALCNKETFPSIEIPEEIDRAALNKFVEVGIEEYFLKKNTPFPERVSFSNQCHQVIADFYSASKTIAKESNRQFALLTSVKTNYNSKVAPMLTQGSILKKTDNTYWLCLQPKCDAIRIENTREFFLASLKKIDNEQSKFDIIVFYKGEYLFFKVIYSIFKAKLLNFKANKNRTVRGVFNNGNILIMGNPNMEWIGELKNDFSQSISNNFAAGLSRVGMDHSEWLRRWASI